MTKSLLLTIGIAAFFGLMTTVFAQTPTNGPQWLSLAELTDKWAGTSLEKIADAAEKGDASAAHFLGYCNVEGFRTNQNLAAGMAWYQRALAGGYVPAANNLGLIYQRGLPGSNDLSKAVYFFTYAAERGLAQAQVNLGLLYRDGNGVPSDPAEALKWFRLAAEQGHLTAMVEVGRLYSLGVAGETNLLEAEKWFQKAAAKNSPLAQLNLGMLYETESRQPEALQFYQQSADQGNSDAMTKLYCCYWEGIGVAQDHVKAMQWLTKAAESGNPWAENIMGYRCKNPESGNPNLIEAFQWYRRSAVQNWTESQYQLGLFYLEGRCVDRDEEQGLILIQKAADKGLKEGLIELATLYAEGIGEPRDDQDRPMELLKRAEARGDLMFRYEYGLGTERDLVEAARCCCQAGMSGLWYDTSLAGKVEFHPSKQPMESELIAPTDEHVQIYGPLRPSDEVASDDVSRVLSLYLKASMGDGPSALQIGQMYLVGHDAPKNADKAWLWFSIATKNGSAEARQKISLTEAAMTNQEIKQIQNQLPDLLQELNKAKAAAQE